MSRFIERKKTSLTIPCRIDNFARPILDRYRCKDRFLIHCIKYQIKTVPRAWCAVI